MLSAALCTETDRIKGTSTQGAEVIPAKIEMIDNQEVLTVSDDNDTIRIPLTEESKADIDALLDAPVGTSKRLKDINGADVTIMKFSANMKPDASSGQKRRNH